MLGRGGPAPTAPGGCPPPPLLEWLYRPQAYLVRELQRLWTGQWQWDTKVRGWRRACHPQALWQCPVRYHCPAQCPEGWQILWKCLSQWLEQWLWQWVLEQWGWG